MLDHIGISVADYGRSRAFYASALAPLGYVAKSEPAGAEGHVCGFGASGHPDFWISDEGRMAPAMHIAFTAPSRKAVADFHAAALAAGGTDNGGPGIRAHYHANYYAAFVHDPDGHNIEAVCHAPGSATDQTQF